MWGTLEQRRKMYEKYNKSEKGIARTKRIDKKKKNYKGSYPQSTSNDFEKYKNTTHCECCGIEFGKSRSGTKKCQDHNHDTGEIRGVICNRCNSAEGHAKTPERAYQIACYMAENIPLIELIAIAQGDVT